MTPGTFLSDPYFRFKNGNVGEKHFVILNYGVAGYYIAAKITSQGEHFGRRFGCQAGDRFPSFYLPRICCPFLNKETWIQMDDFYQFGVEQLERNILDGKIYRIGVLDVKFTVRLMSCVASADDITQAQESEILEARKKLEAGAS